MSFSRHPFRKRDKGRGNERHAPRAGKTPGRERISADHTGPSESDYLKGLVDSRARVTVVLKTGERLTGRIRYYDRYCFSLGLSAQGPRLFLRKASVSYIEEG